MRHTLGQNLSDGCNGCHQGFHLKSILDREHADPNGLNGFILLLHTGAGPGCKDKLHDRLGGLLDSLALKGYRFARIDDVLSAARDLAGVSDAVVPARSIQDDRVLLTSNRDFGELAFHQRMPTTSGIVLFRLKQLPAHVIHHFLQVFFESQPMLRGMFTVSSPGQ